MMRPNEPVDIQRFVGSKTLFAGEVGSGKTRRMAAILNQMVFEGLGPDITVLDLAPERTRGVGGKMPIPRPSSISVLETTIVPPRLTGTTPEAVEALARQNARRIEKRFDTLRSQPRPILFVNDATLYLQAGNVKRFVEILNLSETVLVNVYRGHSLGQDAFSARERRRTESILPVFDKVIWLPG
jgi:hypothetical protein